MNLDKLKSKDFGTLSHAYTAKDTMLYALGVGAGADPLDPLDLRFVYEEQLRALPTMASIVASPGFWMQDPELEIDWVRLLHGEQAIELHRPLPAAATISGSYRVAAVRDRGTEKGSTLYFERVLSDEAGDRIATVRSTYMLRGDGGCGSFGEPFEPGPAMPEREPDEVLCVTTLPRQALLYRLSGDYNPLHADPQIAREAGFDKPIMHGLGSMGIVCHALIRRFLGGDPDQVRSMSQRFAAPSFPGETMAIECFVEGPAIRFRARALERDRIVMDLGTLTTF